MTVGDIVKHAGRVWVIFGRDNTAIPTAPIPGAYILKRQRDDDAQSQDSVVTLGIELVHSPKFTAGMKLTYEEHPCTVIRDEGPTVRIEFARKHDLPGGQHLYWSALQSSVSKGALVLENLQPLMMQ